LGTFEKRPWIENLHISPGRSGKSLVINIKSHSCYTYQKNHSNIYTHTKSLEKDCIRFSSHVLSLYNLREEARHYVRLEREKGMDYDKRVWVGNGYSSG